MSLCLHINSGAGYLLLLFDLQVKKSRGKKVIIWFKYWNIEKCDSFHQFHTDKLQYQMKLNFRLIPSTYLRKNGPRKNDSLATALPV